MIVSCPECAQRFRLDPDQLGAGRRVRCGTCGHVWLQAGEAAPGGEEPSPIAATLDQLAAEMRRKIGVDLDPSPGDTLSSGGLSGSPLGRLRPPPPPVKEKRLSRGALVRWGGLVVVMGGLVAGLMVERVAVVAAWPAAALLYQTIGLPVDPPGAGLEIADYKTEFHDVDGTPMLFIDVTVVNKAGRRLAVPDLMAHARAADGKPFQNWRMMPKTRHLLPGETTLFQARVVEKGGKAKDIHLDYVEPAAGEPVR